MFQALVPEAGINEHGHAASREYDVRPHASARQVDLQVHPVTQACSVKRPPQAQLRGRVDTTDGPHVPATVLGERSRAPSPRLLAAPTILRAILVGRFA